MPQVQPGAALPMPAGVAPSDVEFGTKAPLWRQLGVGRLVMLIPTSHNPADIGYEKGTTQASVTFDLIVCDGQPFTYGDTVKPPSPATHRVDRLPIKFAGVKSSHKWFVQRLAPMVGRNQMLYGRIAREQFAKGDPAWVLADPTDADKALIGQAWQTVHAPGFRNDPVELTPQAGQAYTAAQPAQGSAGQASVQYAQPVSNPPISTTAQYAPPAGYELVWPTLNDQQRAQILAAVGAPTAQGQPPF